MRRLPGFEPKAVSWRGSTASAAMSAPSRHSTEIRVRSRFLLSSRFCLKSHFRLNTKVFSQGATMGTSYGRDSNQHRDTNPRRLSMPFHNFSQSLDFRHHLCCHQPERAHRLFKRERAEEEIRQQIVD